MSVMMRANYQPRVESLDFTKGCIHLYICLRDVDVMLTPRVLQLIYEWGVSRM